MTCERAPGPDRPGAPATPGLRAAALSALLLAAGCTGGTETGNPSFVADLGYGAYSSNSSAVAVRATGGEVSVSAAWIVLGDAGFVEAEGCETDEPVVYSSPGIGVGNHAGAEPARSQLELAATGYCSVRLPLLVAEDAPSLPAEAPGSLTGHSIVLEGTLASGARFSLRSGMDGVLELRPESGEFALDDEEGAVVIGFDVAAWLGELDWAGATASDGLIEVSAAANPALLAAFEARLAGGVGLFRDPDADGRVDAGASALALGRFR